MKVIKKELPEGVRKKFVTKIGKKVKIVNEDSISRPFAVMINNISVARPLQSGLQDAYLMYEIIRFLTLNCNSFSRNFQFSYVR